MNTVTYRSVEYPTKELFLNSFYGTITVATTALGNAIISDDLDGINLDAESIDDEIYFYLDEAEFAKSKKEIKSFLALET